MLFLVLVVFVAFLCANFFYRKSTYFKFINKNLLKFNSIPRDIEVVNIGSFPSIYGFDWENQDCVRGFNLGVGPEEVYYDNKMFQFYVNTNKPSKLIVVHWITPLLFCENKYIRKIPYNIRYSAILPGRDVKVPLVLYYIEKYFPLIRKIISAIINRLKRIFTREQGKEIDRISSKTQADLMIKGWLEQNPSLKDFKDISQYEANKEFIEYQLGQLTELVEFCKSKNITYLAVLGPVSEYIRSYFSDEFISAFVRDNLQKAGVGRNRILDYYDCKKYSSMNNYTNGLFLTEDARRIFTKDIVNELKKRRFL